MYGTQGRYAEAEKLFNQALEIHKEVFGPRHSRIATVLYKMAAMYRHKGDRKNAEEYRKRFLALGATLFAPDRATVGPGSTARRGSCRSRYMRLRTCPGYTPWRYGYPAQGCLVWW